MALRLRDQNNLNNSTSRYHCQILTPVAKTRSFFLFLFLFLPRGIYHGPPTRRRIRSSVSTTSSSSVYTS